MNPTPTDEAVGSPRALRLPHMRSAAPELSATAEARRREPAEATRALPAEELAGRRAPPIRARRNAAGFPTGKTFDARGETAGPIPAPTQRAPRTHPSHRRKGGDATDQLNRGQKTWPPAGDSVGYQRAVLPSATGQISLAIDTLERARIDGCR